MSLSNDPNYQLSFEQGEYKFYTPSDISEYHKSRELNMQAQERYAACGISKEVLKAFAEKIIALCNNELSVPNLRTDLAVIANNLLARMKSPIDELVAIRMGAIACFMEGEDPNKVSHAWTERKIALANDNPNIYDFFLSLGIALIPEYAAALRTSMAEEYLVSRKLMLETLTPQ